MVASPSTPMSTPSGRTSASSALSRAKVAGHRSLPLCTTVLPVTIAAPRIPQATATGSFHGVRASTTPRGCGTDQSAAPNCPRRASPRCTGPSSAYCTSVPMPASTPPRASPGTLPVSRVFRSASSCACARRCSAAACSSAPRSAGAVRAQAPAAARARATALRTSSSVERRTVDAIDPFTGSVTTRSSAAGGAIVMGSFRRRAGPHTVLVLRCVRSRHRASRPSGGAAGRPDGSDR